MKKWSIVVGAVLLVLAVVYGIYFWQLKQKIAQFAHMKPTPTAVSVTAARAIAWRPVVRSSGQLEASRGVTLTAQSQGQVASVHMSAGQWVEAKQLVLSLEDDDLQAQLFSAQAQQQQAKAEYASYQALAAQQNVSTQMLQQKQAALVTAESAVVAARTAVARKEIHAPFACQLGLSRVNVGQFVSVGQPIVDCHNTRKLKLYYSVPQQYFPSLTLQQPLAVSVDAYPERSFAGVLAAMGAKVSESTRGIELEAVVDNPDQALLPGMLVSVAMPLGTSQQVVVVPQTAVHTTLYGDSVFVVDDVNKKPAKVTEVRVTLGDAVGSDTIVLQGIKPGQQVVSLGQANLRDQGLVSVVDAPSSTSGDAAP